LLAPISIQLNQYTFWTFLRNGTNVCGASQGIFTNSNTSATNNSWFNTCIGYVDSPSTSSAISYQIGVYANSSSVVYLNDYSNGNNCQLIAMEIA